MDKRQLAQLKSFIDRSRIREDCLQELYQSEMGMTPVDLADAIDASRPNVSKRLIELKEKELVEVLNPEDNRNRYYALTDKGRELYEKFDWEERSS